MDNDDIETRNPLHAASSASASGEQPTPLDLPIPAAAEAHIFNAAAAAALLHEGPDDDGPPAVDTGCGALLRPRAARLDAALAPERDALLAAARQPYDPSDEWHRALAPWLHAALLGRPFVDGASSWEHLGFQRAESFESDLRSVGVLGLLCVVRLVAEHPALAEYLFALAGGGPPARPAAQPAAAAAVAPAVPPAAAAAAAAAPTPAPPPGSSSEPAVLEWPFAAVGMNVALHALRALRGGRLDKACNAAHRRGAAHAVRNTFMGFYCLSFLEFGRSWARVRRTLGDADGACRFAEHVGHLLQALAAGKVRHVDARLQRFRRTPFGSPASTLVVKTTAPAASPGPAAAAADLRQGDEGSLAAAAAALPDDDAS